MVEIKLPGEDALKEVSGGGRGALRRMFGPALSEFGEMLGDRMKVWRFSNLLRLRDKIDRIAADRNVPPELFTALPFGDAMRTIEAASQEDDDDVQQLWAQLIVRATTQSERPSINKLHIEILRSLGPADSALLELLYPSITTRVFRTKAEVAEFNTAMDAKAEARWRQFSDDERGVSIQNLIRLRCITATPRMFYADGVLKRFLDRERHISGALIDELKFQEMLSRLLSLIYQASGAVEYETKNPIPLHYQNAWSVGHGAFGQITVPEFNHMLTPLGIEFMKAVTLDTSATEPDSGA